MELNVLFLRSIGMTGRSSMSFLVDKHVPGGGADECHPHDRADYCASYDASLVAAAAVSGGCVTTTSRAARVLDHLINVDTSPVHTRFGLGAPDASQRSGCDQEQKTVRNQV